MSVLTMDEATALAERARTLLTEAGLDVDQVVRILATESLGIAVCIGCGCTDMSPCDGGCYWVDAELPLCSVCAEGGPDGAE